MSSSKRALTILLQLYLFSQYLEVKFIFDQTLFKVFPDLYIMPRQLDTYFFLLFFLTFRPAQTVLDTVPKRVPRKCGYRSRLSLSLSVCLSDHIFLCLSVRLSVCLSVSFSVCLSLSVSVYVSLFVTLSLCVSLSVSVCLSGWLAVCLSVCLSVCLCVCLSVCLPPSLSLSLSLPPPPSLSSSSRVKTNNDEQTARRSEKPAENCQEWSNRRN